MRTRIFRRPRTSILALLLGARGRRLLRQEEHLVIEDVFTKDGWRRWRTW